MKIQPDITKLTSGIDNNSTGRSTKRPSVQDLENQKLLEQSRKLESVFIGQMIRAMEKTVPKSTRTGSGNTLSAMMFSQVLSEAVADQGGIGLADMIYGSLKNGSEVDPETLNELGAADQMQRIIPGLVPVKE